MIAYAELGTKGQLGNQLFQIAATLAHADKLNTLAVFPKWEYNKFVEHKINDSYNDFSTFKTVVESSFDFYPIPEIDNINLSGYFQSEKYFKGSKNLIYHHFFPSVELLKQIYGKYGKTLDKKVCSIHVRRGDYLNLPDYHTNLDIEYYIECIKLMDAKVDKFLFFSDDIGWCKDNFSGKKFEFAENNSNVFDLFLMSLCNHHIIANSSFSWWGAYLGKNKDKTVVAPEKWFGKDFGQKTWDDIYVDNWIKI